MEGRHARPPFVHINTLLVQAVPEIPEFHDLIGLDERVVAALGYYLWGGAGQRDGRDAQLPGRRAAEPAQDAGAAVAVAVTGVESGACSRTRVCPGAS